MKASSQAPVSSFWIWTTWARAKELSSFATNSRVAGWSLNFPFRVLSALAIASSREIEGVVEGILAK